MQKTTPPFFAREGSFTTRGLPAFLLLAVGALLLSACGTSSRHSVDSALSLVYRTADGAGEELEPNGGPALLTLDGASLSGSVTVGAVLDETVGVTELRLFLDDVERLDEPFYLGTEAPFEASIDTSELEPGQHTLTAEATASDERVLVTTHVFHVADETAPAPAVPATPAPVDVPATSHHPDFFSVPAATLYVSTNGDDGNDGRTPESAFRTIQKAADVVQPGDTVYVRGGTYPIQVFFRRSGTADQPITWTSYPGEWAVLDGSDEQPYVSKHRVWVENVDHNHFLNFEVKDGPRQGIYVLDSNRNLFRNIVTHGNHGSGIQSTRSDHNRYEYVTTYDNYDYLDSSRPGEHADGIGFHDGDGNVIYASVSYNNSDDGFDTWRSTNSVIDSSIAHHNGRGSHGNGNGFKAGGNRDVVHTVVKNSIAYANKANGFDYNSGQGVSFLNNTSFDNGRYPFVADSSATLRNNIAVGNRPNEFSNPDSAHNSWDLGISDPGFASTDPTSPEFLSLTGGSAAIGAGSDGSDLGALPLGSTYTFRIGSIEAKLDAVLLALH